MHLGTGRQTHATRGTFALKGELTTQFEAQHLAEKGGEARGVTDERTGVRRPANVDRRIDRPNGLQVGSIHAKNHHVIGCNPVHLTNVVGGPVRARERHQRQARRRTEPQRLDDDVAGLEVTHRVADTQRSIEAGVESRTLGG